MAWQGCASIVNVEGTVTGSTAAVTVGVLLEMVITVATGVLAGGWRVGHGWAKSVLPSVEMRKSVCSKGHFVATETHGCW